MDKLLETLNGYLQAAAKLVTTQAPHVWEATKTLIRLQEGIELGIFIILAIVLVIFLFHARSKIIRAATPRYSYCTGCQRGKENAYHSWDMDCWWGTQFIGSIVILTILGVTFLCRVMVIFLGLYDPALLVMYRLAQVAGIM